MCKVSKGKPMVLKIQLEAEAMKDLMAKLDLAGVKIPKTGMAFQKLAGKKAELSIGIHKDTYEKVLNVILGHIMILKSFEGLGEAISEGSIKIPRVDFNGIKVAGDK